MNTAHYVGRFAPSPSGPLHFGSLIAAAACYADARFHQGRWLVRIEDLDPPREQPGADRLILRSLVAHGFRWDEEPLHQSQRQMAYDEACQYLEASGHCFSCCCSRARLAKIGGIYDGHCRIHPPAKVSSCALRLSVPAETAAAFVDVVQGPQIQQVAEEVGDFIIRRKDGLTAYQLAVVVDDAYQGITHVVRGADLLDSTPRQIYLHRCLGFPIPTYAHFPVAGDGGGLKLSKQNRATPVNDDNAAANLRAAFHFLGQETSPNNLQEASEVLHWHCSHWRSDTIPRVLMMTA